MRRTSLRALASRKIHPSLILIGVLCSVGMDVPWAQAAADAGPAGSSYPIASEDAKAARLLMEEWALAQNTLVWKKYAALYAPEFQGIRRSGKRAVTLDRKRWLAERARMFDQGGMSVDVVDPVYESDGAGGVRVRFVQVWASGAYGDRGNKVMVLGRDRDGALKIEHEELLDSEIDHTPIVPEESDDADLLKVIYPNNAGRPKNGESSWTFTNNFEQSWPDTAFGTLKVVLWSESGNPRRHTQFDSEYFGGVAVIRDGRLLGARYGLEGQPKSASLIKAADHAIVAVSETSAFRGEVLEVLEIFVLTKSGLRFKERIPVRMNDTDGDNTYDCDAKVEYRDVNGNGVPDIVVTPVRLRHPKSCNGFPRRERRVLF